MKVPHHEHDEYLFRAHMEQLAYNVEVPRERVDNKVPMPQRGDWKYEHPSFAKTESKLESRIKYFRAKKQSM